MSKINAVLVAFLNLLAGMLASGANKLVRTEYRYRIVRYDTDQLPRIAREITTSDERVALAATTKEFADKGADLAVCERLTNGRWVPIAETPSSREIESFDSGRIDLDGRG